VEGRAFAKRNPPQQSTSRTLSRNHDVSHELERVRQRAKREKGAVFSALFHHLDVDRLRESHGKLKPKAAAGVGGIRWQDYGRNLEENLHDLYGQLHRGALRWRVFSLPTKSQFFLPMTIGLTPFSIQLLSISI